MLRRPDGEEDKQASRLERDGHHRRKPGHIEDARQRYPLRAQFRDQHGGRRGDQERGRDEADRVLFRREPGGQRAQPLLRIGDRTRKHIGDEDENAAGAEREQAVEPSRGAARAAAGAAAIERERTEMLRAEMPGAEDVIDDRERDDALRPRPGQRRIGGQQNGKAQHRDQQRYHDEPERLRLQKRAIGFGRIDEPGAAKPMPDPEQRGDAEVEKIERTARRIGAAIRKPEDKRQKPESVLHKHRIPHRPAHPER